MDHFSFNYCIDEVTLKQAIGEKGVKKLQKYMLCQNAACSRKPFSDALDKRYLTHPEGKINDKREEPYDLVNMQGDSNITKQRKRSSSNKKSKINAILPECSCIGKLIHMDTIAQTDGALETKNKSTGIFKKKNIYTQSKEKYHAEEIATLRNIKYLKNSKQKNKFDVACPCIENELNVIEISENMQPKKSSKWIGKRRHRSRKIWPRQVKEDYEIDSSNNIQSPKQSIYYTLDGERPNEYKINEISKLPQKNKKASTIHFQKEYKGSNICAKGICAEASNEKSDFVCKCKEKPGECTAKTCAIPKMNNKAQSKSLIDIQKIKSLIKYICYNSKKKISNKKILHKPVNIKPDASKKDMKVAIIDKRDNIYEPEHQRICLKCKPDDYKKDIKVSIKDKGDKIYEPEYQRICFISKIENKKSPKKAEIRKREDCAIDRNVTPEQKLTDLSQKNKEKPTCVCPSHNTGYIFPCIIKNKKSPKKTVTPRRINKIPKNAGDQTGEPLIKIEVDGIERCVLNPDEIKHKLTDLSRKNKGKTTTCVFSLDNNRREQNLSKNLCEGRICQKMFKDKKTNFNCKCQHNIDTGGICTDRTCGSNMIQRKLNNCSTRCIKSTELSEPQFEVHLDAKNMCLLNSEEINRKIVEIEAKANEVCPGGTCAVARCESRNLFKCKCVQKKPEVTECSEATCVDEEGPVDLLYYWMSKLTNKYISNKIMKRDSFNTNEIAKIKSMFSFICDRLKRTSEIWNGSEATKQASCALSGNEQKKKTVNKANYHQRSGLNVPLKKSRPAQPTKEKQPAAVAKAKKVKQPPKSTSACGCAKVLAKQKKKQGKEEDKKMDYEEKKLRKERLKKQKIQNKLIAKQMKEEYKEMKELSQQDEAGDTNCFADFVLGFFNVGFGIAHCLLHAMYKIITEPKRSYRYVRRIMRNPELTYQQVLRWASNKWRFQKFRMSRSMKGSRTMNIISDEFKESAMYTAFANKGKTKKEKQLLEAQQKRRQQRIRKRTRQALHGCRDILLVTMRKTPCLWVYHVCPDFYPRFLGLRMNFIKICEMCLFCLAIVVWTPCILCCELARGCLCCLTCSQ